MKFVVLGSHLCPDTRHALEVLKEKQVEVDFHNISEDLGYLKEYLKVREEDAHYEAVKAAGGIGIPCFRFEDGTLTLDLDEALAKLG